jgi:hypothetical protein
MANLKLPTITPAERRTLVFTVINAAAMTLTSYLITKVIDYTKEKLNKDK